jgi:hypothetical protein
VKASEEANVGPIERASANAFCLDHDVASGIKAPLDFSVFSTSAGAFLLAAQDHYLFSFDAWWESRTGSQAE